MEPPNYNFNAIMNHIIENSLFTKKQISIIYNHAKTGQKLPSMTSGAYYRQVKQSKDKVSGVVYSLLLLRSLGILDGGAPLTVDRLAEQISVILSVENSDNLDRSKAESVISVMDQVIKRMSKV